MKDFKDVVQYKVKVKNGAGWRAYKAARLQISVGGERHEGEKFKATIDWVGQNFDRAIICVNDTLQRFNAQVHGMDAGAALVKAAQAGEQWIARHSDEIAALQNVDVIRWDHWRQLPEFTPRHEQVLARYENDRIFREAVDESKKNNLSRPYILEEIAVFSLMYEQETAVDVYPGTLPKAMYVFPDQHQTRIDFARLKMA
jgi:hypothetical protein